MTMEKLEARTNPEATQIAIKTAPNVSLPWYIFNPTAGGYYTDEDEVENWIDVSIPDPAVVPEVG